MEREKTITKPQDESGSTSGDEPKIGSAPPKRTIQTFEDLDVWKVCRQLRIDLAQLARSFPRDEKFRLTDQLIRASRSVTANLAEGYGRFHYTENVQFARHARGSLNEALDHLTVALDEGFIEANSFQSRRGNVLKAAALINGFIRYLISQKRSSGD